MIKSFNDNLPFDQFTIEQLAGDLLPNPTMWQLVATRLQPAAADDARRRRAGRRVPGESPGRPRAERLGNVAGRRRWAAPSATTTSSIRTRRRFLQPGRVLRRRRPLRLVRSRSAATTTPTRAAAGDAGVDAAGLSRRCKKIDAQIAELEAVARRQARRRVAEAARRADRAARSSGSKLEAQFEPTMITQGGRAARDVASCRAATGWTTRARSCSRTCRTSCSSSTRAAGGRLGSIWRTGSCRAINR